MATIKNTVSKFEVESTGEVVELEFNVNTDPAVKTVSVLDNKPPNETLPVSLSDLSLDDAKAFLEAFVAGWNQSATLLSETRTLTLTES